MKINLKELQQRVDSGLINKQKHPNRDIWIYNYSKTCQHERVWDEYTMICRGLVLDADGNVIARPFDKFFNLGEPIYKDKEPMTLDEMISEHGKYTIEEKVDGSLGILFEYNNGWICATRGSFKSDQALMMRSFIDECLDNDLLELSKLPNGYTHLFEIIYPSNRIVVDYLDTEELRYLWSRENESGLYTRFGELTANFSTPVVYDCMKKNIPNAEGYVLHFEDEFRVKVKFEEYTRLHRILTGMNEKAVWEMLKDGKSFDDILENVPDEFMVWLKKMIDEYNMRYAGYECIYKNIFASLKEIGWKDRKEFAQKAVLFEDTSILFAMLDNRDYSDIIWKRLKPSGDVKFKDIEE